MDSNGKLEGVEKELTNPTFRQAERESLEALDALQTQANDLRTPSQQGADSTGKAGSAPPVGDPLPSWGQAPKSAGDGAKAGSGAPKEDYLDVPSMPLIDKR